MKQSVFVVFGFHIFFILSVFSQSIGISDVLFTPKTLVHIHRNSNGNLLQLTNSLTKNFENKGLIFNVFDKDFSIMNNEDGFLAFGSNALERMRILSSGLIGINTANPTSQLTVRGDEATVRLIGPYALGLGARINFGNDNFVFLQEDEPNRLQIYAELSLALMGGFTGIGTLSPSQRLHISNNKQIDGFLRVGSAPVPSTLPSSTSLTLFKWSKQDGLNTMQSQAGCGTAQWSYVVGALNSYYRWDNVGSRSYTPLLTPWIWVPSGVTGIVVGLSFGNTLEAGNDGVYIQYTTDGVNWTTITTWESQGYNNANVAGSNSTCTANYGGPAWTNTGNFAPRSTVLPINGSWVRFRIIGVENAANGGGDFRLYGFTVWVNSLGSIGGSLLAGNVYVEKNVYAGSNVLLGDMAEFLEVSDFSVPGYLISLNESGEFVVSHKQYDKNVIGIHTLRPTITLNSSQGIPVATLGRVYVWATACNGPIRPGDFLTSSSKPGYAIKATRPGYSIGKALEPLEKGEGLILCIINPTWLADINQQSSPILCEQTKIMPHTKQTILVHPYIDTNASIFLTSSDINLNPKIHKKEKGFAIIKHNKTKKTLNLNYCILQSNHDSSDFEQYFKNYSSELELPPLNDDQPTPPTIPDYPHEGWVWIHGKLIPSYHFYYDYPTNLNSSNKK